MTENAVLSSSLALPKRAYMPVPTGDALVVCLPTRLWLLPQA